jgi:glycosyltransferase domain-containing protein
VLQNILELGYDTFNMNLTTINKRRISIIVLTYERHDFIRRQLLYYSNHPVHLIFADGSAVRWPHGQKGISNEMSWEYIHCPGYDTFLERLALATEKVKTEYVCLLDDQECILFTGIKSAIDTLDAEPKHSCAGGLVALGIESNKCSELVPWKRNTQLALLETSPLERFYKIVGPKHLAANLVYQVMRTDDLKNYSSIMRGHNGTSTATHEVALAGFLSLKGKYLMGDYPYWIRNGGTVAPPEGYDVIIKREEIQQIAKKIIDIMNVSNPESFDVNTLASTIESGWGQSSQWAKDSRGYLKGIRMNNNTIKRRLRYFLITMIKFIAPKIYFRVKFNKNSKTNPKLSFLKYATINSNNSYRVLEDLLSLEKIWETFPKGIPAEYWPKTTNS